jgi:hypothetical protein
MYRLLACSVVVLVGVIGCDQPGPIEVLLSDATEPIQVTYLIGSESDHDSLVVAATAVRSNFDVTGILRTEEGLYPATMLVNGVKYDIHGTSEDEKSYSRVAMRDTDAPISATGNFGQVEVFKHLDVGDVSLNGTGLDKEEVFVQIRTPSQNIVRAIGVQYKLLNETPSQTKPFEFRPNIDYAIVAKGRERVHSFTERIDSPDRVAIVHPKPYSLVLADEDLTLRWSGKSGNSVVVVLSYYDGENKQIGRPIMELRSASRANAMLISKKLLNLIPKTSTGKIVLSLISANRAEAAVDGYNGKILVQSASIHHVSVTLK